MKGRTLGLALGLLSAAGALQFRTPDPLKAFVTGEYVAGNDYFIRGSEDTILFRCVLTKAQRPYEGVAYSEISIWGNRTGPWEIFRAEADATYSYVETAQFSDTTCLESCRSKQYLASGECTWTKGWPAPGELQSAP